jgi:hypothetical protein
MANKPVVYLCGPINGCTDGEAKDWREYAKAHLRAETLDPMRRDYRGRELEPGIALEIVRGDEADLCACDYVLAWHPGPSTGTDMEIRAACREYKKCVCTVVPPEVRPSPWLVVHSDIIVNSIEAAIEWINLRVK